MTNRPLGIYISNCRLSAWRGLALLGILCGTDGCGTDRHQSSVTSDADAAVYTCEIESRIALFTREEQVRDCGVLGIDATTDLAARARACVQAALDDQQAFRLLWDTTDTVSTTHWGLTATNASSAYRRYLLTSPDGAVNGELSRMSFCDSLELPSTCPDNEVFCVACTTSRSCGCHRVMPTPFESEFTCIPAPFIY